MSFFGHTGIFKTEPMDYEESDDLLLDGEGGHGAVDTAGYNIEPRDSSALASKFAFWYQASWWSDTL